MECPLATYIKEGEEEAGGQGGCAKGGVLLGLLVQVGFGPLLPINGEGKWEGRKGGGKRGAAPPSLVQFGLGQGGCVPPPVACLRSSTMA